MSRKAAAFLTVFVISVFSSIWLVAQASSQESANVTVHFIDVGQGDSIFVDTSNMDVLIDGGEPSAPSIVLDYLDNLSITHIHLMVATHVHEDHIGGLVDVLNSTMTVDEILINNQTYTTDIYERFMNLTEGHTITVAQRGQTVILADTVNLTVFNPVQPLEFSSINDNSVVVKLRVGNTSFLFTGDAEAAAEQSMLDAGLALESDILKVGHHGSHSSTTQAFLDNVSPEIAIISAGGEYGHPHNETIQKLLAKEVTIYGTYVSGTIVASTDGTTIIFPDNPQPIPEFRIWIILPIFSMTTLLAVTIYRKCMHAKLKSTRSSILHAHKVMKMSSISHATY